MTPCRGIAMTLFLTLALGCSEEAHEFVPSSELSPPEGEPDPTACPAHFGPAYVLDRLEILPLGFGVDLDGDGAADNALGFAADLINPAWRESISAGDDLYVLELAGWSGPSTRDDPELDAAFYQGFDADQPSDPDNNLGGRGEFLVSSHQFDVDCQPTSRFDSASIIDGVLEVNTGRWTIHEPYLGTLTLTDFRASVRFSDDFTTWSGTGGGVYTLCGLSVAPFFGTFGSLLDFLTNNMHLDADIDRDGDGLERVEGDGMSIERCIDGDGTVIAGADCPCHSQIADGFSVGFAGSAVPARIVGVADDYAAL